MSTFLKICQDVARESGTVDGTQPTTVAAQVGRLNDIVSWVNSAWKHVQNLQGSWLFMRKEFTGNVTSGTQRYTGASFGLTDFAEWIKDVDNMSIYQDSIGLADENPLQMITWEEWRWLYGRGVPTVAKPVHFAVSPQNEFVLGPVPDDAYTIRGEYRRDVQTLVENEDLPDMPVRFHDIIVWKALMSLGEYDESPATYGRGLMEYKSVRSDMERDLLPQVIAFQEPLA